MNISFELPCRGCGKAVPVTLKCEADLLDIYNDRVEYVCNGCARMFAHAEIHAFMRHLYEKSAVAA